MKHTFLTLFFTLFLVYFAFAQDSGQADPSQEQQVTKEKESAKAKVRRPNMIVPGMPETGKISPDKPVKPAQDIAQPVLTTQPSEGKVDASKIPQENLNKKSGTVKIRQKNGSHQLSGGKVEASAIPRESLDKKQIYDNEPVINSDSGAGSDENQTPDEGPISDLPQSDDTQKIQDQNDNDSKVKAGSQNVKK